LGINDETILNSLSKYHGSWRRFDIFDLRKFILIDDYAHHPTEIEATLKAAREKYPDKKICCVYQPHQYQRTQFLFEGFINVFKESLNSTIDKLVLIDVYDVVGREGNEDIKKNYNSEIMAERIGSPKCVYSKESGINEQFKDFDVVIIMGAGDIYNISQRIKQEFGYNNSCLNN
jgi:UDP-N-acetylmuramate--alanine ligase